MDFYSKVLIDTKTVACKVLAKFPGWRLDIQFLLQV